MCGVPDKGVDVKPKKGEGDRSGKGWPRATSKKVK